MAVLAKSLSPSSDKMINLGKETSVLSPREEQCGLRQHKTWIRIVHAQACTEEEMRRCTRGDSVSTVIDKHYL